MSILKEYAEKFGIEKVKNNMGKTRITREGSIIFPNG